MKPADMTPVNGWNSFSLNGVIAFGGGFSSPAWRLRPDGTVQFRGVLSPTGTALVAGAVFAQISAGMPTATHVLLASATPGPGRIDVLTNGQLKWQGSSVAVGGYLSLSGLWIPVAS